jgi:hypothetical protein
VGLNVTTWTAIVDTTLMKAVIYFRVSFISHKM